MAENSLSISSNLELPVRCTVIQGNLCLFSDAASFSPLHFSSQLVLMD